MLLSNFNVVAVGHKGLMSSLSLDAINRRELVFVDAQVK